RSLAWAQGLAAASTATTQNGFAAPDAPDLHAAGRDFTVAIWARYTDGYYAPLVEKSDGVNQAVPSEWGLKVDWESKKVFFAASPDGGATAVRVDDPAATNDDQWHLY